MVRHLNTLDFCIINQLLFLLYGWEYKTMSYSVKSKKSGKTYFLHTKEVTLAGNRKQKIYFFAANAGKGSVDALPAGYEVTENKRTGLPLLRKKRASTS